MGRRSERWGRFASAEFVPVEIVDDPPVVGGVGAMMEVACPGGPVIRLREDVPPDVLERVVRVCQRVQSESTLAPGSVRSC